MRIVSIITAILVTAFLFVIVFKRDQLAEFTAAGSAANAAEQPALADDTPAAPATTDDEVAFKVVAFSSKASTIDSAVVLRGETQAARTVTARAETNGLIVNTPLRKGTFVGEADVLCQLDPGTRAANLSDAKARLESARARVPETQARLEEAKAKLDEAKINFNAANKLSEGGFASESRVANAQATVRSAEAAVASAKAGFDTTRSGIQSAEAAVASAEKEIERLTIRAPFAGLLETDTAELGSLLQPGAACATIIQLDPIKLVAFVPETEWARVHLGAPAMARLISGREVTGAVTYLSRSADPLTRTFRVEIEVANSDLSIADGQTAEIVIGADGSLAHLLPQSALTLNDEGALGIRAVGAGNIVEFHPVTLIRDTVDGVWLADLPETLDVITIGQEFVRAGVKVAPTYAETSK
ncbi:efflux RND transporter periplasmic adaptor subunit [Rhodobacteraceae bacterium]|nr:efflux RND transporter periplasmic adaptor subunit [Paracoccaceae bacterium]